MALGHYTELFFLDEATALAAGHRPCAECRRADYERFVMAWVEGNRMATRPAAPTLDSDLHCHRVTRNGQRVTYRAPGDTLPDGTIIALATEAWLVWRGQRHRWSFIGYGDSQPLDHTEVEVLTPQPTVAALCAGYRPAVHQSVEVMTVAGGPGGER
ncbi:hypothetical protein [Devosia chinhatensis]|nr:hypothetical protein [Devosia chinhatensis]